jgi:hypothetical protein
VNLSDIITYFVNWVMQAYTFQKQPKYQGRKSYRKYYIETDEGLDLLQCREKFEPIFFNRCSGGVQYRRQGSQVFDGEYQE